MASYTLLLLGFLLFKINCQAEQVYESENLKNDGKTVLLGGLFPVHATNSNGTVACGEILEDSVQRAEAMVFTINCINENSVMLPKIKLAFSLRDTCSNSIYGLEQAFQYVKTRSYNFTCSNRDHVSVSGVVGAQFSRVSIDIANLLSLYQIPQISYISTADILSDKTRFGYFFRTIPTDSLQARAIADIIILFKWTYVFMLYSDDAYGSGGIEALIEHLNLHDKSTICTAAKIPLSVTASSQDYDVAIEKMSRDYVRNATVVVLFGHLKTAVGMMQALGRARMHGDYTLNNLTWIGTDSWGDSLPSEYHSIVGGILSILPQAIRDPTFDSHFTSLSPDNYSANVWFKELWESMFGCSLSSNGICKMQRENRTLNTTEYQQASRITLVSDAVLAFAHAIHNLVENRCPNSTLCDAILEDRLLGEAINGNLLRQQLYNISFQGPSSNLVSFDPAGIEVGSFSIKNLQRNSMLDEVFSFEIVGTWNHKLSLNFFSDIEWVTGDIPRSVCSNPCEGGKEAIPKVESLCCWSCSTCQSEKSFSDGMSACRDCNESMMPNSKKSSCIPIPVSYLSFSSVWSIVLLTFTIIGLITTAVTLILFFVCYKHRVVKASSREVSVILLVGLVLCYIMPFFFVVLPSPAVCVIRRFGVGFSFVVCLSSLVIKTNRIYRIFNQKSLNSSISPHFTSPLSQVIMTLILIAIQVLLAIIWLAVDYPSTTISYGIKSAVLKCGYSSIVYLVVSLGYNFALLIISIYYAFRARIIPENFNETKYISATLYTLCIIWISFISVYFGTIKFGAIFQATSLMIAIILSATTTLLCIFMPKVFLLFSSLKEKQKTEAADIGTAENYITRMSVSK